MPPSGRAPDQMRDIAFEPGFTRHAEGSCLVSFGDTRVLCTASVETQLPPWLRGKGQGWVTAEYGMLPRSTTTRNQRDSSRSRPDGRTLEIQRLIGRSLRGAVNLRALGERSIVIDCDVLQADGGTRTAAITGAWVALMEAIIGLRDTNQVRGLPLQGNVAAISVGIVDGEPMLDLAYTEDVRAETDMNVVATGKGLFVEVQGTAERTPFDRAELYRLLDLALSGTDRLAAIQRDVLAAVAS